MSDTEPAPETLASDVKDWIYDHLYDVIPEGPNLPDGWKAAYDEEIHTLDLPVGETAYVVLAPDGAAYEVEVTVAVRKVEPTTT